MRISLFLFSSMWLTVVGAAQDTASDDVLRQLLPVGDDLDPLGVGDLGALQEVTLWSPDEVLPDVEEGPVLAAIPGVREIDHRLDISLHEGFATIDVVQRFVHRGRHPAELAYQQRLPDGASLHSFEVCVQDRCRPGVIGDTGSEGTGRYDELFLTTQTETHEIAQTGAHAWFRLDDNRLLVRVAPLTHEETVELRWRYGVPAIAHGGVLRVDLPARGHDLRIAPAVVQVHQGEYRRAQLNGRPIEPDDGRPGYDRSGRSVETWQPVELSAHLPPGPPRTVRTRYACDVENMPAVCEHTYQEAALRSSGPLEITLLLDVSPSTLGPARGRMTDVVSALINTLPPGSHLRAAAFAGRTEILVGDRTEARQVPTDLVARAFGLELGAATHIGDALRQFSFRAHDQVIILGDGGLSSWTNEADEANDGLALPPGVRGSYVQLADRPIHPALQGWVERSHGELLFTAERLEPSRALEPLSRLYAPYVLGRLAAGESVHRDRVHVQGRAARRVLRRIRRAGSTPLRGYPHLSTAVPEDERGSLVVVRTGDVFLPEAEVVPPARSLSSEPVLNMLRTRLVPAARACFRRDRHGRERYSVRATYELVFADREVAHVEVHGEVAPELRSCLTHAADQLVVPAFDSVVRVRYPLYTVTHGPSAIIELGARAIEEIDRAGFDEEDPMTPPALQ